MRVYVVEDDALKRASLEEFLSEKFPSWSVSCFGSFHTGLKGVESTPPDLLILDMTLPNFDRKPGVRDGRLRNLGGYELISKIRLKQINTKIVVVTGFSAFGEGSARPSFQAIEEKCRHDFGDIFGGMVYYQHMNMEWRETLEKYILLVLGIK